MSLDLIILVSSLLFSAFFSGMEIAFVSSNKISLEIQKTQKKSFGHLLKTITKSPSRFIVSMLIGNNIALVVYGIFSGKLIIEKIFPTYLNLSSHPLEIILYQTLISTSVILITAEFLPKVFFQIYSNRVLSLFVFPAYIFYQIMKPLSWFVLKLSNWMLLKLFNVSPSDESIAFSKADLGDFVSEHIDSKNGSKNDSELQIFQNALNFTDLKAREVMVPRAEIIGVDRYEKLNSLIEFFSNTGYSKILVYAQSVDNIIGYVHAFDMFFKPKNLHSIIKAVEFIPETMRIQDIFNLLLKKRRSIAIVLDEYGGTSGMITLEDIVEELFGEIEDEHDNYDLHEKKISEGVYELSSRLEIEYLNKSYDLNLPESESYDTLGGLIVFNKEEIPKVGDEIIINGYSIQILHASSSKIEKVVLKKTHQE